jgi:hypothetical protein
MYAKVIGPNLFRTTLCLRPNDDAPPVARLGQVEELHPPAALPRLLPRADFVVLATPGTADTAQVKGGRSGGRGGREGGRWGVCGSSGRTAQHP